MAHVFKNFLKTDWKNIKTVSLTLNANSKKAVNDMIKLVKGTFNGESHIVVKLDATILKGVDKIALLVANSIFINRNIDAFRFQAIQVTLSGLDEFEIDNNHRNFFNHIAQKGGTVSDYIDSKDTNWYMMNAILNEQVNVLLKKLSVVQEKYETHIKMLPETLPNLEYPERRWNFRTQQFDLFTLYKRCFNEIDQILAPASCCNPNPSFQRELVWSLDKKKRFIYSILRELPIGSFYVNETNEYDPNFVLGEGFGSLLWDGKQRIHALHDFISGKYSVLVNGIETYYYENPGYFTLRFKNSMITVFESSFETLREIIEAYVVINSAQVKHTDEDLEKAIKYLEEQGKLS